MPVQARKAGHDRGAETRLELGEARVVDKSCDHLVHVVGLARVAWQNAVELLGVVGGRDDRGRGPETPGCAWSERLEDRSRDGECMVVVLGQVVGNAGDPGVDVAATEFLGTHDLAGGRLHERWPAQEDRPLAGDDHRLAASAHQRAARNRRCTR